MQFGIVCLVIAAAVGYLGWRLYRRFVGKGRCRGCPMSDYCHDGEQ